MDLILNDKVIDLFALVQLSIPSLLCVNFSRACHLIEFVSSVSQSPLLFLHLFSDVPRDLVVPVNTANNKNKNNNNKNKNNNNKNKNKNNNINNKQNHTEFYSKTFLTEVS